APRGCAHRARVGRPHRRLCRPPAVLRDGPRTRPLRPRVFGARRGTELARRPHPGIACTWARRRVDGAAARDTACAVAAAGAVEAARRRARPERDHGRRARGRGRPPRAAAGTARCSVAPAVPDGDRDPVTFGTVELDALRRRRSEKWRKFPPDVLPSHIAEMDFAVAPEIEEVLVAAVRAGDLGYVH